MTTRILRIDASARRNGSISRELSDRIIARFANEGPTDVVTRDLAGTMPQIDEAWIGANFTPADDRSDDQRNTLAFSDELVAELKAADVVVLGAPIYNFGVPAKLKSWIDQIARAGVTFRYSEAGPKGLLEGKRAVIAVASGGTSVGSEVDFATGYLRHVLGFIGITDIEIVAADRLMVDPEASMKAADDALEALRPAA